MNVLERLQQSADRVKQYNAAMGSFELYGESCALCGGYSIAAMDEELQNDPAFATLRTSMVDLFGESRVLALESQDETQPLSAAVNTQAISYADSVVRSRVAVESSDEYKVLSQIMSDASYVSTQRDMIGVAGIDTEQARAQTETLFKTYAAVSCDLVAGLETVKELARNEMVRYFGEDVVAKLDTAKEAGIANDAEAFDKIVGDTVDLYLSRTPEDDMQNTEEGSEYEDQDQMNGPGESADKQDDGVQPEAIPRSVMANMESNTELQPANDDAEPEY